MTTIVLTLPHFFDGEAELIARFLRRGDVDLIHLRKPNCSANQLEQLILRIPNDLRNRLVVHNHFQLAVSHHLHGIHLNSRCSEAPCRWEGSVSRSCHSLDEVLQWKERCTYVSLSPIFDSVSKQGYCSAFTPQQIYEAHRQGIIDHRVYALGGVTFGRLAEVRDLGFGGAMILGDAWKNL